MNFDWIKTRSDFDEEKLAIIDPFKGTEWSYQELNIRAENLANHLIEQGMQRGDVVGIFAPNDVAILDLMAASFKTGIIFLPLNWRLNPKEIDKIIQDSGLKLLFYAKKHVSSLSMVDPHLLHMDIDSKAYDDVVNPEHPHAFKSVSVEPDDIAALIYTSGTTGDPKGVMFSYESFMNNGANIQLTYRLNSDFTTIIATPMFHVLGLNDTVLPAMMAGSTLVIQRYFEGQMLNEFISTYQPDFLILIPTMYYSTIRQDNFNPEDFRAIKYVIQGGSHPLPSIQEAFKQYGINIINGYGLTEAPLVVVNTPDNARVKPMSIGKAVMFVDARILDDDHNDVAPGEIGELSVKARNITPGYWNKPDKTAEIIQDGYLLTGDLAKQDEDGDIYIVDRKKELIITGGENVLPSEVETVLAQHPLVDRCVVVGYNDPKFGESIGAAVILREQPSDFEAQLDAHMRETLAAYKVPKLYKSVDTMPLNTTQKPDKIKISEMMNEIAEAQLKANQ